MVANVATKDYGAVMNRHSRAAQSAAAHGSSLEADLLRFHTTLTDWYVVKTEPVFRKTGKVWTPTENGPPDFFGVAPRLGRSALFDAKHHAGSRWPVCIKRGDNYQGLKPHQRAHLKAFHEAGGVAGVYLRVDEGDVWVPFRVVDAAWSAWWGDGVTRYLGFSDGIPVTGFDWTKVIACL